MAQPPTEDLPARCPRCRTGRLFDDIDGVSCVNCGHPVQADQGTERDAWQAMVEKVLKARGTRLRGGSATTEASCSWCRLSRSLGVTDSRRYWTCHPGSGTRKPGTWSRVRQQDAIEKG